MLTAVGLIGCGEVSRHYGQYSRRGRDQFPLRAATDPCERAGLAFSTEYQCDYEPSLERFLSRRFDLICICTPNATHANLASLAASAGSCVLIEHPLATTVKDARNVLEASARARVKVFVMRQRRFLKSVQILKNLVLSEQFGRVLEIKASLLWKRHLAYFTESRWRCDPANGGVIMNQASHFIDILLYVFGTPTICHGIIGNIGYDIPVEDSAYAEMTFANGIKGSLAATIAAPEGIKSASLAVRFERRSVTLGGAAWETLTGLTPSEVDRIAASIGDHRGGDHEAYLTRVVDSMSGADVEIVDGLDGMRAVILIEQIYDEFRRDSHHIRRVFEKVFGD